MGGKGGSAKQQVIDYRISLHMGVCGGPVDVVKEVRMGEKPLEITPMTSTGMQAVSKTGLFGGAKKGGGAIGNIFYLLGHADQLMPDVLASRFGRTPTTMSGYRGLLTLFFCGTQGIQNQSGGTGSIFDLLRRNNAAGFTIGSNNPIVPAIDVTVTRRPRGLDVNSSMIGENANPAHILYECLWDSNFGAGYESSQIDSTSFLNCAETLRQENFGLSYTWLRSTTLEQFVNEILVTIAANLTFNFVTGMWELKLLRGDYDARRLKEVNPGNAKLDSFQRKMWGETVNEVILTWVNPANEKEETVTVHDNANIAIQNGDIVSDSSPNYPGIRDQALALKVAERELRQASAPLAAAEVKVDGAFFKTKAGDVLRFRWPEEDITSPIVMRVLKVKYPRKGNGELALSLLEDVFSFGVANTEAEPGIPVQPQRPVDLTRWGISTAPYFLVAQTFGDQAAQAMQYPQNYAWLFGASGLTDIRAIDLLEKNSDGNFVEAGTIDEASYIVTPVVFPVQAETTFTRPTPSFSNQALDVGSYLIFNLGQEVARVKAVDRDAGTVTIDRGLMDTVPQSWPSGTPVYVVDEEVRQLDLTARSAAETVNYKFLPITSQGRLEPDEATERTGTLISRLQRPLRPANLRANGTRIPTASVSSTADVNLTWSTRNRLTETTIPRTWEEGSATPEVGQTTRVRVYDGTTLITTVDGLTGTAATLTPAQLGSPSAGANRRIVVDSQRDGLDSLQAATITLNITA